MTAIELKDEITNLRGREISLKEQQARAVNALARALAVEPHRYDERAVSHARSVKVRIEQELVDLGDRIAALESQLPSPDAIERAKAEAEALTGEARTANQRTAEAWDTFIVSLDAAFVSAAALSTARATAMASAARLDGLKREFAIVIPRQEESRPSANDLRFAQLVATFLQELSVGQRNDELMHALNAMRTDRQVQSEGAA